MAATRERRGNAGNKMAKLLDEEEEDDFYKTSYGGFEETENDRDYIQKNDDEDDIVDSDFSIDENDEPVSDNEEETNKRRKTTNKRAYKEPPPKKPNQTKEQKAKVKVKKSITKRLKSKRSTYTVLDSGKISLRKSTALKSAATEHRIKARTEAAKKKPKSSKSDDWIPTQEELLEEALITEEENLASLEKFKQMEIEKKKTRPTKRIFTGPTIRYHSLSMPLIEVLPKRTRESNRAVAAASAEESTTKTEDEDGPRKSIAVSTGPRCERTFITFENDINESAFNSIFTPAKKRRNGNYICSITKLPARYLDPITRLPYRNKEAFKVIREAYYQYLEAWADPKLVDLDKWLAYRAKIKEQRLKSKKLNHVQSV